MVYLYAYKLKEKEKHSSQRFMEDAISRYFATEACKGKVRSKLPMMGTQDYRNKDENCSCGIDIRLSERFTERPISEGSDGLAAGRVFEGLAAGQVSDGLAAGQVSDGLAAGRVSEGSDGLAAGQVFEGLAAGQVSDGSDGLAAGRVSDSNQEGRIYEAESIKVFKDERGKPYINKEGFFISATHSGNLVVCGISTAPLGIDIQVYQDNIKYKAIAKRFFTQQESELINKSDKELFFKIWTIKEAFAKHDGRGLAYGLKNIQTVRAKELFESAEAARFGPDFRFGKDSCFEQKDHLTTGSLLLEQSISHTTEDDLAEQSGLREALDEKVYLADEIAEKDSPNLKEEGVSEDDRSLLPDGNGILLHRETMEATKNFVEKDNLKSESVGGEGIMSENLILNAINGVRILTQRYKDMLFACAGGEGDLKWIEVER